MKLRRLKSGLRNNDLVETLAYFASGLNESELITMREQKLLLAPRNLDIQRQVANAYLFASRNTLPTPELEKTTRYIQFTTLAVRHFQLLSQRMEQAIRFLGEQRRQEQLLIFNDLAEELTSGLQQNKAEALSRNINPKDVRDVQISEYLLHEYNGLQNETWWGLLRALNEVFRRTSGDNRIRAVKRSRAAARQEFVQLFQLSMDWNNFEYLVDKVSFGEWYLDALAQEEKPRLSFALCDATYERAKLIGLRRSISDRTRIGLNGNRTVFPLEAMALKCAEEAIDYWSTFTSHPHTIAASDPQLVEAARQIAASFHYEDEKLFNATSAGPEIQLHYLVGAILAGSMIGGAAAAVKAGAHSLRKFREQGLPLTFFRGIADRNGWSRATFDRILGDSIAELPAPGYISLMRAPYLLLDGRIRPLGFLNHGWTDQVRARLLKGGVNGRLLGRTWEDACAELFREFGWKIVGQGIKLRRAGVTLGDVDILVAKNSLLLVIQCKAIAIPGDTIYDHWLARSKVIEGAEQALTACEFLDAESAQLENLLRGAKLPSRPMCLQPLVITSALAFTGWNPKGVPVASEGVIRSILRGAKVKFTTGDGTQVGEESHIDGLTPSEAEFVQFLSRPLDWRIASKSEHFYVRTIETEYHTVSMPELKAPIAERAKVVANSISIQG